MLSDCPPFPPHRTREAKLAYRTLRRLGCGHPPAAHSESDPRFRPWERGAPIFSPLPSSITYANEVLQGRLRLWSQEVAFSHHPAWHRDLVSGHEWPSDRPLKLFPIPGPPGALRRVWELNRMAWLPHLGEAFRATGCDEFADHGWRHIEDWIRANPPSCGINWTSPLEMAIRVLNWLRFLDVTYTSMPGTIASLIWRSVNTQTGYTAWHLSLRDAPNNHLAAEALLLLTVGIQCPHLTSATSWCAMGRDLLVWMADTCLPDDGTPSEGSLGYASFVTELYLIADQLLEAFVLPPFPEPVIRRLHAAIRLFEELSVRLPRFPDTGDWDGTSVVQVPLSGDAEDSPGSGLRDRWLHTPRWRKAIAHGSPCFSWPIGRSAASTPREARHSFRSDVVCEGFSMATRFDLTVVVATGRLGLPPLFGHGHADALEVLAWVRDHAVFIDPGTYTYADGPWREYFRSTRGHCTVEVEGASQALPVQDFTWCAPYSCHRWASGTGALFELVGSHDGYLRLPQRVHHCRRVRLSAAGLEVEDSLFGRSPFGARLHWHIDPSWRVTRADNGRCDLSGNDTSLVMRIAGPGEMSVSSGTLDPPLGWYSPCFGRRAPATTILMETRASLIRWITTLHEVTRSS